METDMTQMIVGHEGLSASGFRKRKRQRSFWQASSRPRVVRGQTRVSMGSVLLAYPHTKKSDVLKIQYRLGSDRLTLLSRARAGASQSTNTLELFQFHVRYGTF